MFDKFIKASNEYTDFGKSINAPYIRRSFDLSFVPSKAILRIVSTGFYELHLNGKRITREYLAPYISNPTQMLLYDKYDIREYVAAGKNAVGVILGNGFANQTVRSWNYSSADFRAPLSFSMEIVAESTENSFSLISDESFKIHPSHIVYDMYRYGTHIDARMEIKEWSCADFDDNSWQNALIAPRPLEKILRSTVSPIAKICEIAPVKIEKQSNIHYLKTAYRNGENVPFSKTSGYLYDFGI